MTNYPPGVSESTPEAPWNKGPKNQDQEDAWNELHALQRAQVDFHGLETELAWSGLFITQAKHLVMIKLGINDRIKYLEQKLGVE